MLNQWLEGYIEAKQSLTTSVSLESVKEILEIVQTTWNNDRQIFACGNGGSGSTASHFITDLGKLTVSDKFSRIRSICLNANQSWISAIGNDIDFESIFIEQLKNYANPHDLVFFFSVSGNSPNLVKTAHWCRENKLVSIALTGNPDSKLSKLADHQLCAQDNHYGRVEEIHLMLAHMITYGLCEKNNIKPNI